MTRFKRILQVLAAIGFLILLPLVGIFLWWILLSLAAIAICSFVVVAAWEWTKDRPAPPGSSSPLPTKPKRPEPIFFSDVAKSRATGNSPESD